MVSSSSSGFSTVSGLIGTNGIIPFGSMGIAGGQSNRISVSFSFSLESSQSNVSPSINRASIAIFSSALLSFRGSASLSMFGSVLVDGTALSVAFASLCITVIVEVTGVIMLALVTVVVVVVVVDVEVTTLVIFVYIPELSSISVYCATYRAS